MSDIPVPTRSRSLVGLAVRPAVVDVEHVRAKRGRCRKGRRKASDAPRATCERERSGDRTWSAGLQARAHRDGDAPGSWPSRGRAAASMRRRKGQRELVCGTRAAAAERGGRRRSRDAPSTAARRREHREATVDLDSRPRTAQLRERSGVALALPAPHPTLAHSSPHSRSASSPVLHTACHSILKRPEPTCAPAECEREEREGGGGERAMKRKRASSATPRSRESGLTMQGGQGG